MRKTPRHSNIMKDLEVDVAKVVLLSQTRKWMT